MSERDRVGDPGQEGDSWGLDAAEAQLPGAEPHDASGLSGDDLPPMSSFEGSMAAELHLSPGDRVDAYEIVGLLGEGSFGCVYSARDVNLGRMAALKFLKAHSGALNERLFEREAKAIAALGQHPGIVHIYGWGEFRKNAYFALEHLTCSLHDMAVDAGGVLHWREAARLVAEACDAIQFAHERHMLHRDIKPGNLLYDKDTDRVKVVDFGLVSAWQTGEESLLRGQCCGTPHYMPPEQAFGDEDIGPTADVFALGATLCSLLCRRTPYEGSTSQQIVRRLQSNQRTPVRQLCENAPDAIVAIIEKATAYERENRYQTAAELGAACRDALKAVPISDVPTEPSSAPKLPPEKPTKRGAPPSARWWPRLIAPALLLLAAWVWAVLGPTWKHPALPAANVAQADELLDKGELSAAAAAYKAYLATYPEDDAAHRGLGYAHARQAQYEPAEKSFRAIADTPMQSESLAALSYFRNDPDAHDALQRVAGTAPSKYPDVLLARLELLAESYDRVVERLEAVERTHLAYDWQFHEALKTLGQAYYRTKALNKAQKTFEQITGAETGGGDLMAAAYLERVRRESDVALREATRQQIDALSKRLEAMQHQPPSPEALWDSRPLRFILLPADGGTSRYANETGLADCLPDLLGPRLTERARLEWVDRDELDVLLAEQELSAALSTDSGQLALGRVLGARLLIKCSFRLLLGEDLLLAKVVDVETTARHPAGEITLTRQNSPRAVLDALAESVEDAVQAAYPLRARLRQGPGGVQISIGAACGVKEGMTFLVSNKMDVNTSLPGVTAHVVRVIDSDASAVELSGLRPGDLPEQGLYVIEQQAADDAS